MANKNIKIKNDDFEKAKHVIKNKKGILGDKSQ
jgi:hypothetical protein